MVITRLQAIKKAFIRIIWKENEIYNVNINVITHGNTSYSVKLNKTQEKDECSILPMRYLITILGFLSFAILNAQRVNIVMALVVMTNSTESSKTAFAGSECSVTADSNSTYSSTTKPKTFNWNSEMEGYILSSSFVGFVLTQVVGGRLSEYLGAKQMLSFSIFCASLCNLISPMAAGWNIYLLIMAQFVKGMAHGVILPAVSCLMANWYPKTDLTCLSSVTFSGFPAGALIGGIGSGALSDSYFLGGWPSVFYVFGTLGIVLALLLLFLIHNSPEECGISQNGNNKQFSEKDESLKVEKFKTPWCKILSSIPTWALFSGVFGQYWMTLYFISVHPTYLANVLNFNATDSGVYSSLPYISQVFVTWFSSYIAELFVKKQYATTDSVRKWCNTLSCLTFSIGMLGLASSGCSISLNTVCFFIAMSSVGMGFPGSLTVPMDMTKQFAGTLTGFSSTVGSASGFIIPVIVGYLSRGEQTLRQWNKIMYISAAVVTGSAFFFHLFGSAKLQDWDCESPDVKKSEEGMTVKCVT